MRVLRRYPAGKDSGSRWPWPEQALDFIDDDELVEITPKESRLRKKFLTESDRKRASRAA